MKYLLFFIIIFGAQASNAECSMFPKLGMLYENCNEYVSKSCEHVPVEDKKVCGSKTKFVSPPAMLLEYTKNCMLGVFGGLKKTWEFLKSMFAGAFKLFKDKAARDKASGTTKEIIAAGFDVIPMIMSDIFSSPTKFLKKFTGLIAGVIDSTGAAMGCRNTQGKEKLVCEVIGQFVLPPLAMFKLLLSGPKYIKQFPNVAKSVKNKIQKIGGKKTSGKNNKSKGYLLDSNGNNRKLDELIPKNKRDSTVVLEMDQVGHNSIRYFDSNGVAKYADGTPPYHLISKDLIPGTTKKGLGKGRLFADDRLKSGYHFVIEGDPSDIAKMVKHTENQIGRVSLACTKSACDTLKAGGLDVIDEFIPTVEGTFKNMINLADKGAAKGFSVKVVNNSGLKNKAYEEIAKKTTKSVKINTGAYIWASTAGPTGVYLLMNENK